MAESRKKGGERNGAASVYFPEAVSDASTHESDSGDGNKPIAATNDVLNKGDALGRYLVLEQLGAGAMGVVYAAYDPELDRKIAIKILRPHEGKGDRARRQERLVREAKAMAKLSHPNVGAIFDVGVHGDQVFLAMEFLSGGTLRDWVTSQKRPWREIVKVFIEVGKGLAGAHAEGLIHRDFKPDNVLLDKNGVPKVVDFGLVRLNSSALDRSTTGSIDVVADTQDLAREEAAALSVAKTALADLTRTGALTGTPAFMAAEQFLGKPIDARTDQFAFCIALYEALYGERPFAGDTVIGLAESVTSGRVKAAPKDARVPVWIRRILLRGLSVEPSQRYASMEALAVALANDPAKRTRKWLMAGATLATTLAVVGLWNRSGKPRTMCTGAGQRLAGIWEQGAAASPRKTAIRDAFTASGKSYAAQAYASVARLFDQYADRWTGMYTDACQATHVRGEQSAEVLDLRMACLNERLGNARALSDVFATADGKVVENAVSAAAALPSLDRCADVPLLRAVVKPPEDPATRERVNELRAELAQLVALRNSGQCARAIPKADPLIARVRDVNYQPLLADTLFQSGQIGIDCGDVLGMLQRFKEAHAVASASHNDDIAAQASSLIPPFAINRLAQTVVAQEWLVVARGDVARLGHETLADAMLAQAEGMLALSEQAYDRALAAADRSIAVTQRLLGPDDPLTIQWEANKADWQRAAGHLNEALQGDVRVREQIQRVLGREHPRVALILNNEGEVLNLLGRHLEAEAAYRSATTLFRQNSVDAEVLAWSLTGLGRALLGQEKAAEAVAPLEEALTIRLERHAPGAQIGETRFALARALWSRPTGRRRALALGTSARGDYGDDAKAVAEIDAWLHHARIERI
jgi:eukaryotic-like serine/threonine-protein kinase